MWYLWKMAVAFEDMFSQSFFSLHVQSRIGQLEYNLIAHPTFLGYNKKI